MAGLIGFFVSAVRAKITPALRRPWRTIGLSSIVALDKSRTDSRTRPRNGKPSRKPAGEVSPPPTGPMISGAPSVPEKVGITPRPPGQVVHKIERVLSMRAHGRPAALRAATWRLYVRSQTGSVALLQRPKGNLREQPANQLQRRVSLRGRESPHRDGLEGPRTVTSSPSRAASDIQFHAEPCSEPRLGAQA